MSVLDNKTILTALAALDQKLKLDRDVELLIVGGAAGVLTGLLPAAWTTADVDMLHCDLPSDREAVLDAAADVCRELSLPANWLNDWGGLFAWTLPDDWKSRRVLVGEFYRLRVYAVGRLDLIAMKFIAHRERDLEHLTQLNVTVDDKDFDGRYLNNLDRSNPDYAGTIAMARTYLEGWKAQP
jgi:hypothetical protein